MEAENGRHYEPKHASLCIFLKGLTPISRPCCVARDLTAALHNSYASILPLLWKHLNICHPKLFQEQQTVEYDCSLICFVL